MWSGSLMLKVSPELADIRTDILKGLLCIPAHRTALSCPCLVQKNMRATKHFPGSAKLNICLNVLHACCLGCVTCGQWASKSPCMLHLPPLERSANKEIYWTMLRCWFLPTAGLRLTGNGVCGVCSVTSPSSRTVLSTLIFKPRFTSLLHPSHHWRNKWHSQLSAQTQ